MIGQGGKSSWGNRDVNGYVRVHVETVIDNNGEPQRRTTFYVVLSDGVHAVIDDDTISSDDLKRGNVKVDISDADKKKVELTLNNGSLDCSAAIKKRASRAFSWWLRTAHSDSDHHFYIVTTSGTCYGTYPVSSYNVTPAFRIG